MKIQKTQKNKQYISRKNEIRCFDYKKVPISFSKLELLLVETRGIEPLSESTFTRISPGAVYLLTFLPQYADKQAYCFRRVMLHDERNS